MPNVPKRKLSKRARKALNAKQRALWTYNPATRRIENKKRAPKRGGAGRYTEESE